MGEVTHGSIVRAGWICTNCREPGGVFQWNVGHQKWCDDCLDRKLHADAVARLSSPSAPESHTEEAK